MLPYVHPCSSIKWKLLERLPLTFWDWWWLAPRILPICWSLLSLFWLGGFDINLLGFPKDKLISSFFVELVGIWFLTIAFNLYHVTYLVLKFHAFSFHLYILWKWSCVFSCKKAKNSWSHELQVWSMNFDLWQKSNKTSRIIYQIIAKKLIWFICDRLEKKNLKPENKKWEKKSSK